MMFPASIPLYLLSRESKPAATVMLAGEGADEILAGYDGNVRAYWMNRLASPIPAAGPPAAPPLPNPRRAGAAPPPGARRENHMTAGSPPLWGHIYIVTG